MLKRFDKNFFILSLYVDGILLAGNDSGMIVDTKNWFSQSLKFEMKDIGVISWEVQGLYLESK